MALPWLRIVDTLLGVADVAVRRRRPQEGLEQTPLGGSTGPLEARLTGVVLAALKEAFNRDHQRLELEREQIEAERQRAERALQLELQRQASDRELGRLRLITAVGVASWLGTLFFSARLVSGGTAGRTALGIGWLLLLGAVAASFTGQGRLARSLSESANASSPAAWSSGPAGAAAPWLIVGGLAAIGLGVLLI